MRDLTWLTVTKYLYHKWQRTCFVSRNDNPVLSWFVTDHRVCSNIYATGATSGTGTGYSFQSPEFTILFLVGFALLDLKFHCLSFLFWLLYCLSFDLRCLIIPLLSSNFCAKRRCSNAAKPVKCYTCIISQHSAPGRHFINLQPPTIWFTGILFPEKKIFEDDSCI